MSPTASRWYPCSANTRIAASRIRVRLSAWTIERSVNEGEDRGTLRPRATARRTLVVDFTRYLPGAYAGRELMRLGARVVRVEPPGGDPMRSTATAWDTALRSGGGVGRLRPSRRCCLRARALLSRRCRARWLPAGSGTATRRRAARRPGDGRLLLGYRVRRRCALSATCRPRCQLPRLGGRPRAHAPRAAAPPGRRPRRRRARCRHAGARGLLDRTRTGRGAASSSR